MEVKPGDRVLALRLHREANHGHLYYIPATVVDVKSGQQSKESGPDGRTTGGVIACGGNGEEPDVWVHVRYDEPFKNGWGTVTSEVTLHISRIRPSEATSIAEIDDSPSGDR